VGEKEEEKGIPKDVFEKDPRIRIVGEGEEKPLPSEGKISEDEKALAPEEKPKEELTRETGEEKEIEELEEEGAVSEEKEEEQKVVEVEESLEQLISAPTIETPVEEVKSGEATYYEFEESEEGLKKVEVGEVVTYGTDTPQEHYVEKETKGKGLIFWAALGTVIFLIFLGFLIIGFLLRL
jgi:hypothetical protein